MDQLNSVKQNNYWVLESTTNDGKPWIIHIDSLPFTIGRDPSCDLTLDVGNVSRKHAQIQASGKFLWIRDLKSANGTFLNNNRISESEQLKSGDVLHFSKTVFLIKENTDTDFEEFDDGEDLSEQTITFESLPTEELPVPLLSYKPHFKKMLNEKNVTPYFQPIIKLSDQKIIGYEILGRTLVKELPFSPLELFKVASLCNSEFELSALFRDEGIRIGSNLPDSPKLFVNTHPVELQHFNRLQKSLENLRENFPSTLIILEINEEAITNIETMHKLKEVLAALNIGLAYDDFGVGQTRLVELSEFPPDYLKFDISIIRNIHIAPKRLHQMVTTFINMANELGIATLAEGVEYKEESQTCIDLGFEYAQGYLFGKPAPV